MAVSSMKRVPPSGPRSARLVLVGEAPGQHEVRTGQPFVGKAGEILNSILHASGLSRAEAYVTNVCKTRPNPEGKNEKEKNDFGALYLDKSRNEPSPYLLECWEELRAEIRDLPSPRLIVCMGGEALRALTGFRNITAHRGSVYEFEGIPLLATIHPARLVYDELAKLAFFKDMRRAAEILNGTYHRRVYTFHTNPTVVEAKEWIEAANGADFLSFDIETGMEGERPIICIGLSTHVGEAICLHSEALRTVLADGSLQTLLTNPRIRKIGQNVRFDCWKIYADWNFLPTNIWLDTMIAHHTLYPEINHQKQKNPVLSNSLEFLVSVYTTNPYYKDGLRGTREELWEYNCKDAAYTLEVAFALDDCLKEVGMHTYFHDHVMRLHDPLLAMELRGMRVSEGMREDARLRITREYEGCQWILDEAISKVFPDYPITKPSKQRAWAGTRYLNVHSGPQLSTFFFDALRLKPIGRKTTSGRYSFDETHLTKYQRRHGGELFSLILHMRSLDKQRQLMEAPLSTDGRFRCCFKQSTTLTGRLSSTQFHDGTGSNLQNITYEMRKWFIPDEGMIFAYADYERAEAHVAFHLADEKEAEEYIASGKDIYWRTAQAIPEFGIGDSPYDPENPHHVKVRKVAKEQVLGGNYGLGYKRFGERLYERAGVRISDEEARRYLEAYHHLYPGIRGVFQRRVEETVRLSRTLSNPFGRKIQFYRTITDKMLTDCYAWVPQSTIGDTTLKAMLNAWEDIKDRDDIHMLLNVHDAILFQLKPDILPWFLSRVRKWMLFPLQFHREPFVLGISCETGHSWGTLSEIELPAEEQGMTNEEMQVVD